MLVSSPPLQAPSLALEFLVLNTTTMAALVPVASGTLRLVHGTGNLTSANIAGSGGDVAVQLDAAHWLKQASGGAQTASWRELEVTMAAACYFNKSALASVLLTRSAISLSTMADVFRSAIAKGLSDENRAEAASKRRCTILQHSFVPFVPQAPLISPSMRQASFATWTHGHQQCLFR